MDRAPLALADTIESLRNDVELMWSDIQTSFDRIDREIGRSIIKYGNTTFDPIAGVTNTFRDDTRLYAEHPPAVFASPVQAQINRTMRRSPPEQHVDIAGYEPMDDVPRHRTYSTPIASHTIPTPTFVRRSTIPRFDQESSAPSNDSNERSIGGINHRQNIQHLHSMIVSDFNVRFCQFVCQSVLEQSALSTSFESLCSVSLMYLILLLIVLRLSMHSLYSFPYVQNWNI